MATPLFDAKLIDRQVTSSLPAGFVVRPLEVTDYEKGFLHALSHLTVVGDISKAAFVDRFSYLRAHNYEYFTIVIEDVHKQRIAAAGTVLVERKFIRNLGLVGHIEDIVTHEDYRGKQFGRYIIEALKSIGKNVGCYKIILDCSEKNVPFYQKCGFEKKEVEMVWYIQGSNKSALPKAKL
ncbi:acyl-CoA N-acyltransferase [Catenaria anguillulae PL171]|uniref:Glucosamine 6-phosphate N-acetyltransferase n=1 Tax=Catenaria anguillulae PL171 TaxID=765915 RepID=A0A1Y2I4X4_9FUNG|nr:acyl-CoA N-acyltransferase [Catenaria anguillulae PL171]